MFEDRFSEVFYRVEIDLAQSYPVINDNCEIVFFYSTLPNDEESYIIDKIKYLYSRNLYDGEIKKIELSQIDATLLSKCQGEVIRPLIFDDEAYDAEDLYYEDYELIYEALTEKKQIQKPIFDELISTFNKLVPEGSLKELYKVLGEQIFSGQIL